MSEQADASPSEPRDYRRIIDLVGGAVITVLALVVALLVLLVGLFSHSVVSQSCDRATGPVRCNGALLGGGLTLLLVGVVVVTIGMLARQLRAYRSDEGLWSWPLVSIGAVLGVLLISLLLMRTAHPAAVGAVHRLATVLSGTEVLSGTAVPSGTAVLSGTVVP